MGATVKRSLTLYFSNKASVFFSLMGAWIAFALYIVFLQKNMLDDWGNLTNGAILLDKWVIGGILAVTSITTTWTGIVRMIQDKESQKFADFLLTDTSSLKLHFGYFISASAIGTVMQIIMLLIMTGFFYWQDGLTLSLTQVLQLVGIMLVTSFLGAGTGILIGQFFKTVEAAERFSVIIGTASGFLVGVYLPIGNLPNFAQYLVKLTPGTYAAAAYRQILTADTLAGKGQSALAVKEYLGIGLKWSDLTTLSQNTLVVISVAFLSLLLFSLFQLVKKPLLR
ncbi:ABC transporter permease [Streptococcus pantholopis]|uniref:Multidrug ABC transporter permease n=1 Tax=Streptococcus pantholopis TaxID=1811193 RepID=A0A172Q8Y5_9STRE|nr:ABC transporter permease [Streptococcus pantholopis]AND79920.1 multidrug ABC transporter permease [Streptococcus pantholopis]